jgi:alpha-glucosidase
VTVAAEEPDPGSVLALYREALRLRRQHPALGDGDLHWESAGESAGEDVLLFGREPGFSCLTNLSAAPVGVPEGRRVLLASRPLTGDGTVPPDTTVWLAD